MKYTFFWNGPFSNWYPSIFTIGVMTFSHMEQWMMWCKAQLMGDEETSKLIMEAKYPSTQKTLGKLVKNFDQDKWDRHCEALVYQGLKAKFEQNPNLLKELYKGKGTIFVEASPDDRIWGIGYGEWDAIKNISNWGENKLGKLLTKLCEEICK